MLKLFLKNKIFFLLSCLYLFFLLIITPAFFTKDKAELFFDAFNKISIGLGALMAGLAGFQYIESYLLQKQKEEERIKLIDKYTKLFPIEEFGGEKKYNLVQPESRKGTIYIGERTNNAEKPYKFYHVGNRWTLRDIELFAYPVITLLDSLFDNCDYGHPILTRGEVGE